MNKENNRQSKGPSFGLTDNFPKRQMWEEIVKKYKGEFKVNFDSGHTAEIHNISIPHKKWNIEISVSDTRPLKFHLSSASLQNFSLTISWDDFTEKILRIFSKTRIKLGWKEFDKLYLIKSNRPDFVKGIFERNIQKIMLRYNIFPISYTTNPKTKEAKLTSVIQRSAGDKEMNIELIEMFKTVIDKLEKLRIII